MINALIDHKLITTLQKGRERISQTQVRYF